MSEAGEVLEACAADYGDGDGIWVVGFSRGITEGKLLFFFGEGRWADRDRNLRFWTWCLAKRMISRNE